MERESFKEELICSLPCEIFLPQHVAGNWRVPGRGNLGRRVDWLGLHCPQVVVADMVVHHGGEGWREGQASRGKERMITTQAQQKHYTKKDLTKMDPRKKQKDQNQSK